jgi:hypothetical protein
MTPTKLVLIAVTAVLGSIGLNAIHTPTAQATASPQALVLVLDPDDPPEEPEPANPLPDVAAAYTKCKSVTVNLPAGKAAVSVLNTSCKFGRDFVHKNESTLCGPEPTKGWRKKFSGSGELITVTLIKGSKRIRTNACSVLLITDLSSISLSGAYTPIQALTPAFAPDDDLNADAAYTKCKPVTVNLGAIRASVSVLNTSCVFGRGFVRANRAALCDSAPVKGWRKRFSGGGEDVTLTLSKRDKRIRTSACGALEISEPDPGDDPDPGEG